MAVASDIPALENEVQFEKAENSISSGTRASDPDRQLATLTGNDNRILRRGARDLAVHQERGHRDRGQALLRAPRRRLPGHRARPVAGRPRRQRRAGRLDDHAAVREERARRAGRPLRVPEAARGRRRVPPRAQVVEAEDPHAVPELHLLRQRRVRDRVRHAHVLRRGGRHPRRERRPARAARPDDRRADRDGRDRRRKGDPRSGRAAGRNDRLAFGVRPAAGSRRREGAARPRAPADARAGDDQPGAVRRGHQLD